MSNKLVIDLSGASLRDKLDSLSAGDICIYKNVPLSGMTRDEIVDAVIRKFSGAAEVKRIDFKKRDFTVRFLVKDQLKFRLVIFDLDWVA